MTPLKMSQHEHPEHSNGVRYRTIVADPPWHYPHGYGRGVDREMPYTTMSLGDICALPVTDIAVKMSSHLSRLSEKLLPWVWEMTPYGWAKECSVHRQCDCCGRMFWRWRRYVCKECI